MKYKSIQIFALINITLMSFASLEYKLFPLFSQPYLFLYISMLLKNAGIASFLEYLNSDKPYIIPRSKSINLTFQSSKNIAIVSFVDTLSLYICINYLCYSYSFYPGLFDYLLFIPRSFVFEIIFDLFHYWSHRLCHLNKILYRHVHSRHHADSEISVYTTFEQHPIDLLLTNTLPVVLTTLILPSDSLFIFLFFWYKSFLEISGHLGKENKGLSFPQFIWLPKVFNICLKSKNHNHHHIRPMKNFGKRFALWDKVFGTFED